MCGMHSHRYFNELNELGSAQDDGTGPVRTLLDRSLQAGRGRGRVQKVDKFTYLISNKVSTGPYSCQRDGKHWPEPLPFAQEDGSEPANIGMQAMRMIRSNTRPMYKCMYKGTVHVFAYDVRQAPISELQPKP